MLKKIDHIAIAVEDLDKSIAFYEKVLKLKVSTRESIASFAVETATVEIGGTEIELVEGKSDESAVRRFVDKHGSAIHHIAFLVEDIDRAMKELRAEGVRFIDEKPRPGKGGSRVAFMHPASTRGVLYELVEKKGD